MKEGVGHQVKSTGDKTGGVFAEGGIVTIQAEGHDHVTELGDGRIGENSFNVVLDQADGGSQERGNQADDGDDHGGFGRADEDIH